MENNTYLPKRWLNHHDKVCYAAELDDTAYTHFVITKHKPPDDPMGTGRKDWLC